MSGESDAMARTTRWAREAAQMRREILAPHQLCFGIVQGGTDLTLRQRHLDELTGLDFDGSERVLAPGSRVVLEPRDR